MSFPYKHHVLKFMLLFPAQGQLKLCTLLLWIFPFQWPNQIGAAVHRFACQDTLHLKIIAPILMVSFVAGPWCPGGRMENICHAAIHLRGDNFEMQSIHIFFSCCVFVDLAGPVCYTWESCCTLAAQPSFQRELTQRHQSNQILRNKEPPGFPDSPGSQIRGLMRQIREHDHFKDFHMGAWRPCGA